MIIALPHPSASFKRPVAPAMSFGAEGPRSDTRAVLSGHVSFVSCSLENVLNFGLLRLGYLGSDFLDLPQ